MLLRKKAFWNICGGIVMFGEFVLLPLALSVAGYPHPNPALLLVFSLWWTIGLAGVAFLVALTMVAFAVSGPYESNREEGLKMLAYDGRCMMLYANPVGLAYVALVCFFWRVLYPFGWLCLFAIRWMVSPNK